jgi:hypothetical protein
MRARPSSETVADWRGWGEHELRNHLKAVHLEEDAIGRLFSDSWNCGEILPELTRADLAGLGFKGGHIAKMKVLFQKHGIPNAELNPRPEENETRRSTEDGEPLIEIKVRKLPYVYRGTFSVRVRPTDPIQTAIPALDWQFDLPYLSLGGTRLMSDKSFEDYSIQSGTTLDLKVSWEGWLFVKWYKKKSLTLKVCSEDRIEDVKRMVQKEDGIPPDEQQFTFLGKYIEEGMKLSDYDVSEGSTIYLMLRLRG